MTTLHVQNVPDDLYSRLQQLASAQNSTISAQVITLLECALSTKMQHFQSNTPKSITEILAESRSRRRINPTDFGLPDSTTLIREDRGR